MSGFFLFCGPTLPELRVEADSAELTVLPPIAHGDLFRLDPQVGDVVAIVDGYFFERPPIRHQEILSLLRRGIVVVGASSMGALRAAELHPLGMRGVGSIFHQYRLGIIEADDEVAVLHAEESEGYRVVSEPLVNIRATCRRAVKVGVISAVDGMALIEAARALPFGERRWPQLFTDSVRNPAADRGAITRMQDSLADLRVDLKAVDAKRLLQVLGRWREYGVPEVPRADVLPPTVYEVLWRDQERADYVDEQGSRISDADVLACAQTLAVDYPAFHERAAMTLAVALGAGWRGSETVDGAEAGQRVTAAARITDEDLPHWLRSRHLTVQEAAAHFARADVVRLATGTTEGEPSWDALIDGTVRFGRASGMFGPSGAHALVERSWLTEEEWDVLDKDAQTARVIVRSLHLAPGIIYRPALVAALKVSNGFTEALKATRRARDFNASLLVKDARYSLTRISHTKMLKWFIGRWGGAKNPHAAATSRGFTSRDNLTEKITPFYPIDFLTTEFRRWALAASELASSSGQQA